MSYGWQDIIRVGFDKNGEADFRICAVIGELTQKQMDELRVMTFVAIGTAEDMRRRAVAERGPQAMQDTPSGSASIRSTEAEVGE